jgi:hypothetical protein
MTNGVDEGIEDVLKRASYIHARKPERFRVLGAKRIYSSERLAGNLLI